MVLAVARIAIHLPQSRSLKDKRRVMKSLLARVRNQFQVAAGEVAEQDRWQLGVLGLACVSTDAAHADEVISRAVAFVAASLPEGDMLDYETEVVHVF